MKIGYPCKNLTVQCKGDRTFRLKSYSEERLISTVENNLRCLLEMLRFNAANGILFFRITSDLVPFASHPICKFDWQTFFAGMFEEIGHFIRSHHMRISMHPDQFTLINSIDPAIFGRSRAELLYHAEVLQALDLDTTAKIQIHVGGVYGDRDASIDRFLVRLHLLDESIRQRLVIENDDRNYSLSDCLRIAGLTGLPVLFDTLHHAVKTSGETIREAMERVSSTWGEKDGLPMVDFSSQAEGRKAGTHSHSIDPHEFGRFLEETGPFDFDVMLEIKDKETSALRAIQTASGDPRFRGR
jgi:UV DNA damage endonuclease